MIVGGLISDQRMGVVIVGRGRGGMSGMSRIMALGESVRMVAR